MLAMALAAVASLAARQKNAVTGLFSFPLSSPLFWLTCLYTPVRPAVFHG